MTVARIRERPGADSVDVMFLESARVYRLVRSHPRFDHILASLRDALARRRPLTVRLPALDSGDIDDVEP